MMDKIKLYSIRPAMRLSLLSAMLVFCGLGCSLLTVPYVDDFSNLSRITTPSVEGVMAASTTPRDAHRSLAATSLRSQREFVSHNPLFFEDEHEVAFEEDGSFAWTGEDFAQVFLGSGRFLVTTLLYPVSMLDTPPWSTMVSDGRPSRNVWGVEQDAAKQP